MLQKAVCCFLPSRRHADSDASLWSSHLLLKMSLFLYSAGYIGNGLYLIATEWGLVLGNWLRVLDPTLHLQAVVTVLGSVVFWQLVGAVVLGLLLSQLATHVISWVKPTFGAFKWYWTWSWTALLKTPFFLLQVLAGIYVGLDLLALIVNLFIGSVTAEGIEVLLALTRLYLAFLPLAIVHLVWDNRWNNKWGKLGLTVVTLVVCMAFTMFTEFWWLQSTTYPPAC